MSNPFHAPANRNRLAGVAVSVGDRGANEVLGYQHMAVAGLSCEECGPVTSSPLETAELRSVKKVNCDPIFQEIEPREFHARCQATRLLIVSQAPSSRPASRGSERAFRNRGCFSRIPNTPNLSSSFTHCFYD